MKIQSLASRDYHRACLAPVEKELEKLEVSVVRGEREPYNKSEVDGTLIASVTYLNPALINKLKRPIFFMPHGVAVVKTTLYDLHKKADYMLMTGPIWKERMEFLFPKYKNNIEVGFPKSDELVNGKSTRNEVINELGLDEKEPIIVYAPSWDDKDALRKGSIDALPNVLSLPYKNILLCIHEYDKMFKTLEGKKVIKAPNKNRYLLAADLVIGDISSIMIEFALLNKPMVHIDMTGDRHHYGVWEEPASHFGEFQVGEFATPDQLEAKVKDAFKNPDKFKQLREYWVSRSFYNLGVASKVSASRIKLLTEQYIPPKKRFIFF